MSGPVEQAQAVPRAAKRVLVADDDADVCALLALVLRPLAAVRIVHDAESALRVLAAEPPYDMIISDFMLPGITGLEFVERVRAQPQMAKTPILMISGHDRSALDARSLAVGADAYLDKPFTLAQLRAAVGTLLGPSVSFA